MKKTKYFVFLFVVCLWYNQTNAQTSSYRVINDEGIGNVIFAGESIPNSQESSVTIINQVKSGNPIFARAYFPKTISAYSIKPDENIIAQVFVDNKSVDRMYIKPKPEWDQMLVYVCQTGDDDFQRLSDELYYLDAGEHVLTIKIGLQVFSHYEKVLKDDGRFIEERVDKIIPLSEGKLTVITE
ncbi:MAG: hypothetical protein PHH30_02850 [Bacteroidales bacterium]|nr:hypothetical protein [Bacteroidales bacterium]